MANTHKFRLPSGIECEVEEFTGKHQRMLTEQKGKPLGENLNEIIADIVVGLGGEQKRITPEFVKDMLSVDRRWILIQARNFTQAHDPMFKFTYEYLDKDGEKQNLPLEIPVTTVGITPETEPTEENPDPDKVTDTFPMKPVNVIDPVTGDVVGALTPTSYDDVLKAKMVVITLPKSGRKLRFRMLDGKGESVGMETKKKERSSHTPLVMRNPCDMIESSSEKGRYNYIASNLDAMKMQDIEFLRKCIKNSEGGVDTEIMFEHPEADLKPQQEKNVVVDVLGVVAFFFPSEAI